MAHLKVSKMGFLPTNFGLIGDKPAFIVKEPKYVGTPKYGAFRVGNGPKSVTYFSVDEPEAKKGFFKKSNPVGKLYVDTNQNGDLSDDGPGDWNQTKVVDAINSYITTVPVHASWGTALSETEGGTYNLYVYKRHGSTGGGFAKISGREGTLELGEKSYSVVLAENANDGIFTVPAKGDLTRRHVELYIDLDGDGTFLGLTETVDGKEQKSPERFSVSAPIPIEGQWYLARPSISGAQLTLTPVDPPGSGVATSDLKIESRPMLAVGTVAPDFVATSPDGGSVTLNDFKGKLLIIDFWATWCGPCLAAMPTLEKLHQSVKDQGVEVLSLNVLDTKEAFDSWIVKNRGTKYNFAFAFDPAGKNRETSIASSKYNVPVLPVMYVLSREGKVLGVFGGAEKEEKLVKVLKEQGITIEEDLAD